VPKQRLKNKRVILGVTGGIAAYKSAEIIRNLQGLGADVRVVMTQSAKEFITPLTLQALSGYPVSDDLLDPQAEAAMGHIELARFADLVLIAPASADFIARLAQGRGNDLLSALCLATSAKRAVAPAMNREMWVDEATQSNIKTLSSRGIHLFGPGDGEQACGEFGPGRMLEPLEITEHCAGLFETGSLCDKSVIITAGPTQEAIDPVRFFSNHSSGKMGFAMAQAAVEAGANVTLISGPVNLDTPEHVNRINVVSALEMFDAAMTEINHCDIFIGAAAVADYRCEKISSKKMAKEVGGVSIQLIPTPDILKEVSENTSQTFIAGFAAQTDNLIENAREKLLRKKIDLIAANIVGNSETGFGGDENALTVLWKGGQKEFPLASKNKIARDLIDLIAERYYEKYSIKNN